MKFKDKLLQGNLIKRYKRFLIDIKYKKKLLRHIVQTLDQCMVFLKETIKFGFLNLIIQKES